MHTQRGDVDNGRYWINEQWEMTPWTQSAMFRINVQQWMINYEWKAEIISKEQTNKNERRNGRKYWNNEKNTSREEGKTIYPLIN